MDTKKELLIQRQKEMRDLKDDGKTLQEIADVYKVSRERVRQIISKPTFKIKKKKSSYYIRKTDRVYKRRENPRWDLYRNQYLKESHRENRILAMEILGSSCKRCGFSDIRALQVDHINGG